jgi:hypothetical protein
MRLSNSESDYPRQFAEGWLRGSGLQASGLRFANPEYGLEGVHRRLVKRF